MARKKIVLAYSGGLDTSVIMKWLQDKYDYDVVAMIGNLGQDEDLDAAVAKAWKTGACAVYCEDLQQEFADKGVFPMLKAGAMYEHKYLLGTSIGRPFIARRQVEIAHKEGAVAVAHGATGKGNDQVRFELTFAALDPSLEVIAPWKDPNFELVSREKMLAYAEKHGIEVPVSKKKIYSEDANFWHISHEGGNLEDPMNEPNSDVYTYSRTIDNAEDKAEYVKLTFEKGIVTKLNDKEVDGVTLIKELNVIGARHAIGQVDMVENRLVGMKSRGVYETPGGTILSKAYTEIEELVFDRDTMHYKQQMSIKYTDLVYDGMWFTPLRSAMDKFFDSLHTVTTGEVTLKLYKGNIITSTKNSPNSLYSDELASFEEDDVYNQEDAKGFIRLLSLPLRQRALRGIKIDD